MRIALQDFERELEKTKSMDDSQRDATLRVLRSADVYERINGVDHPVEVKLIDSGLSSPRISQDELDASMKRVMANLPPTEWQKKHGRNPLNPLGFNGDGGGIKSGRGARMGAFVGKLFGMKGADSWCASAGIKGHVESNNALGGVLVPEQVERDIIDLRNEYGVFRANSFVLPMTSDTATRPRRTGGLTAYYVGEANAGTQSTKSWDQISLTAKKLMVISVFSSELNEDSFANIGDDLSREIAFAFAQKEDEAGFNGDGTSTYGGIVGLRTKLTTINGVDDGGGIVLGTGNLWSELTLADFQNVIARTPSFAKANARWFMSPTFIDQVPMKFALNAGGITASEILGGVKQRMFLGYPIVPVEVMPTAQANSQVCALFGDLTKASTFGDRRGITIKIFDSGEADGVDLLETDQLAIRGTERYDLNVHDVGTSSEAGAIVGLITASS